MCTEPGDAGLESPLRTSELVRIAILFQLKYKDKIDAALLAQIIDQNSDSKKFCS